MKCPNCGDELGIEFISEAASESKMTFRIEPKNGERFCADTIGGTLLDMSKLLKAVGKEVGFKTTVFVENIIMTEDGAVESKLIIARSGKSLKK